ncbi:MAG TPA: hypothetical protein VKP13_11425 [Nitrospira sp.]|nr:hypothetical protein [Nitrospira sp.]
MKFRLLALVFLGLLIVQTPAYGQWKQEPSTGSPPERLPDRTTLVGQSGIGPFLKARLADKENNAKKRRAVVVVQTDGVKLVSATNETIPKLDEAHIQYKLDDGPVRNSTEPTWTFDDLSPGEHEIHVSLAGNDNRVIGKGITLTVTVP